MDTAWLLVLSAVDSLALLTSNPFTLFVMLGSGLNWRPVWLPFIPCLPICLHWFFSIIIGISNNAGLAILGFKDSFLSLLKLVLKDCKTEHSYLYMSTLLYTLLRALIEYYPEDTLERGDCQN
ncbi:uncharacterized protein PGTG_12953 [Puccinia graminis f. sp. tritici CRL 75-36-700-3]|uniref:Proteasome activator Blm10 middle HEAT repeats region domain-containing protein n=1 Tax=Puccinia graminis f. sp. tritici (strain CRL 75-36-700-3 / race SCCL) TaxID=418459 RepID=E3KQJ6_PUCGT|nr:uncharacterized protein PGTG_12953 [Puccinia graminis f. sp. tritici CRL 75-36-700-3]EFP86571.1 hypothetical protein PGTG_12953 [Puccinia graminis f. sp. tritici CRL 75-36-700-3]